MRALRAEAGPGRAVLWAEGSFGIAGLGLAIIGMAVGIATPVHKMPLGAGALLRAALQGNASGLAAAGLWLLVLAPVAAIAAGTGWAIRTRHTRTVLLSLVALAAIALAAFALPTG
jgi:hypothetical protein